MMLDDTRCGLDVSSLHRTTSMDNYIAKTVELLSCHRDTLSKYFELLQTLFYYLDVNIKTKEIRHDKV